MDSHVGAPSLCRLAVKVLSHDRDNNSLHIESENESNRFTIKLDRSEPRDYRLGELYEFWTQMVGDTHYLLTAFQLNIYEYDILRDTLRLMRKSVSGI